MGLLLGGATSDRVDCGSEAAIDNLDPFTILLWCYPTSWTSNRAIWAKDSTGILRKVMLIDATTGNQIQLIVDCATTDGNYISTNAGVLINTWNFLAASFNPADAVTSKVKLYSGKLQVPVFRCSITVASEPSGSVASDSADTMYWGNGFLGSGGLTSSFQGIIAVGAVVARDMPIDEIQSWQRNPRIIPNTRNFIHFGWNATGIQEDISGNNVHGSVTGCTVERHVPLPEYWRRAG